jgi:hypothetical protein
LLLTNFPKQLRLNITELFFISNPLFKYLKLLREPSRFLKNQQELLKCTLNGLYQKPCPPHPHRFWFQGRRFKATRNGFSVLRRAKTNIARNFCSVRDDYKAGPFHISLGATALLVVYIVNNMNKTNIKVFPFLHSVTYVLKMHENVCTRQGMYSETYMYCS